MFPFLRIRRSQALPAMANADAVGRLNDLVAPSTLQLAADRADRRLRQTLGKIRSRQLQNGAIASVRNSSSAHPGVPSAIKILARRRQAGGPARPLRGERLDYAEAAAREPNRREPEIKDPYP